ncbi:MAG: nucleotidyltransferase family protein [Desulfobaccales bacterium]
MLLAHPLIPPALDLGSADPEVRLRAVLQFTRQANSPGFLETLREQRLTCFLYQTLAQFPRQEVGDVPLLTELRRDYLAGLRGWKIQEKETNLLMTALAEAQVEAIVLKGGDIRYRLYDDPVSRPMGDVDVLIPPADLDKVRIILKKLGYLLLPRDIDRGPNFNARFMWEEMHYCTRYDKVFIDLHWEIRKMGAFYRLPYAALRAKATAGAIPGVPWLVLCPEHLLMSLCLNTLEELEQAPIMKLVDLDRALRLLPLDWELFLEDAAVFHIEGALSWVLREMAKLRPRTVPEFVLGKLSHYTPGWSEKLILRRQEGSLLVGFLTSVCRNLPVKEWPAYIKAKVWPNSAFIQGNTGTYANRLDYFQHLLRRSQDKT